MCNGFCAQVAKPILVESRKLLTIYLIIFTFIMKGHCVLMLISFKFCFSEWILIPSISSNQSEVSKKPPVSQDFRLNLKLMKNISVQTENTCPDFHNLTMLSYGLMEQEQWNHPPNDWAISTEDINDLIEQNKKIPKTSMERFNFLQEVQEKLMNETERKIKSFFSAGMREARTKYAHSSMESALLTISMLLFGVYLTKVMVKLLQSHYSKYNSNIGIMNGIQTPIIIAQTRRTRSSSTDLKELHLMHLIEKYKTQFN